MPYIEWIKRRLAHVWALTAYAVAAVAFNWPLAAHLSDRLPGAISGDTGVYVWNLWLFRHEIVAHHRFPLFTQEVLSLTPPIDLSLHNYTLLPDVLAFPLIPIVGVTATFNLLYLALTVVTAWAMFLLARSIVRRDAEAWLAGLLFAFSPVLVARSTEHFSLATAAPLPLFLLALRRAERDDHWRWAAACGAIAGAAALFDAYYGIFCIVITAVYCGARHIHLDCGHRDGSGARPGVVRFIDGLIAIAAGAIVFIATTGGTELRMLGQPVAMRSLYNPVLLLTGLVLLRAYLRYRPRLVVMDVQRRIATRFVIVAGAACTLLLAPTLVALAHSLKDGAVLHGPSYWRSTPSGIDLLALFAPNPNHPLGEPWRQWLASRPNRFEENVASLTLVAIAVLGMAVWRYRFRPSRVWVVVTLFFAALAVGPFVHVGGVNTYVPGPWALLRYVPVLTATRMPARYAIPMMMTFSLLFALALRHIAAAHPARRRVIVAAVGVLLAFELSPYPRRLHSAHVPEIFDIIAKDPRDDIRVLGLPFGFRDGEWSEGNFSQAWQFYQTVHEKRLIGGYLSRISQREMRRQRESSTVRHLLRLSEGVKPSDADVEEIKRRAPGFVDRARLGYVFVDAARTPPVLRRVAIEAYGLVKIAESDGLELYTPTVGTFAASR